MDALFVLQPLWISQFCVLTVSTEQPFTSTTERPLVSVEQAYFLSSY